MNRNLIRITLFALLLASCNSVQADPQCSATRAKDGVHGTQHPQMVKMVQMATTEALT